MIRRTVGCVGSSAKSPRASSAHVRRWSPGRLGRTPPTAQKPTVFRPSACHRHAAGPAPEANVHQSVPETMGRKGAPRSAIRVDALDSCRARKSLRPVIRGAAQSWMNEWQVSESHRTRLKGRWWAHSGRRMHPGTASAALRRQRSVSSMDEHLHEVRLAKVVKAHRSTSMMTTHLPHA